MILLESMPAGRVFALDQQTFISIAIQLFNASFLAVVLALILYRPVQEFMRKRTERIKNSIAQAENDKIQAEELKKQYEKRLNDIELERDELLSAARMLASEKNRQVLAEAKEEAEAVRARAATDIQLEYDRVKDDMKRSIIDTSSAMAARVVEDMLDQETHDKLIAGILVKLEEMSWQE